MRISEQILAGTLKQGGCIRSFWRRSARLAGTPPPPRCAGWPGAGNPGGTGRHAALSCGFCGGAEVAGLC